MVVSFTSGFRVVPSQAQALEATVRISGYIAVSCEVSFPILIQCSMFLIQFFQRRVLYGHPLALIQAYEYKDNASAAISWV